MNELCLCVTLIYSGSIDGSPPGSVVTTYQPLPDIGEVLYLNPNDPATQLLLITQPSNNLLADTTADLGFHQPTGVEADTSAIDISFSQHTSNLQPILPPSQSYSQAEEPTQRHIFHPGLGVSEEDFPPSPPCKKRKNSSSFQVLSLLGRIFWGFFLPRFSFQL